MQLGFLTCGISSICVCFTLHYSDIIMRMIPSQITAVSTVCLDIYSGTDQRKHQSSTSLAFVRGIHRSLLDHSHKRPVTCKIFPFGDAILVFHKSLFFLQSLTLWFCIVVLYVSCPSQIESAPKILADKNTAQYSFIFIDAFSFLANHWTSFYNERDMPCMRVHDVHDMINTFSHEHNHCFCIQIYFQK